jgi:hypothetical protein
VKKLIEEGKRAARAAMDAQAGKPAEEPAAAAPPVAEEGTEPQRE